MTAASVTVMALYLSPWIKSDDVYAETVAEAVRDAQEVHARRDMDIDQAMREACRESQAQHGAEHAPLLAWAQKVASDFEAGRLPHAPHSDSASSGFAYKGVSATWGDLRAAYGSDLPDGSLR